ncbi:MAG: hypothetical protein QXU18_01765 [Thermoplasmatales archaeon]
MFLLSIEKVSGFGSKLKTLAPLVAANRENIPTLAPQSTTISPFMGLNYFDVYGFVIRA